MAEISSVPFYSRIHELARKIEELTKLISVRNAHIHELERRLTQLEKTGNKNTHYQTLERRLTDLERSI